jgi:hypothetical protein
MFCSLTLFRNFVPFYVEPAEKSILTDILDAVSLLKLSVDDSAGVSFTANTDSFKYTVTLELVKYQFSINET